MILLNALFEKGQIKAVIDRCYPLEQIIKAHRYVDEGHKKGNVIITAIVIIILGVAIYRIAGHINKTMAMIALSFYLLEAVLVVVGQAFVFSLANASKLYLSNGDTGLLSIGNVLLSCRHFAGEIAMIPFGLGAISFYYLLMKVGTIPKWLALWGLVTVPFVLVGIPLTTFGIAVPFALFVPYVPFEFFTGIYILIRYRKKPILKTDK